MKNPCVICYFRGVEYNEEKCSDCDFKIAMDILKGCRNDYKDPKKMLIYIERINDLIHEPISVTIDKKELYNANHKE